MLIQLLFAVSLGAQDPVLPPLTVGRTLSGEIAVDAREVLAEELEPFEDEPPISGNGYRIAVEEDGNYAIELRALTFDAYLVLRGPAGNMVEDNDELGALDARIEVELKAGVPYEVFACAVFGGRGDFDLRLIKGPRKDRRSAEVKQRAEIEELERKVRELGENDPPPACFGILLHTLGVRLRADDSERAVEVLERAVAALEEHFGPGHLRAGPTLNELAKLLHGLARYAEALPHVQRALELAEAELGAEHAWTGMLHFSAARVLHALDRLDEAVAAAERAREVLEVGGHPAALYAIQELGLCYVDAKRLDLARPLLEEALEGSVRELGAEHSFTAESRCQLGRLYTRLNELDLARDQLEQAQTFFEQARGHETDLALTWASLAGVHHDACDYDSARRLSERAVDTMAEYYLDPSHPTRVETEHFHGHLLGKHFSEFDAARPLLERTLELRRRSLPEGDPAIAGVLSDLGDLMRRQGLYLEADPLLREAQAIYERCEGVDAPLAKCHAQLGAMLKDQKRSAEAQPHMEAAVELRRNDFDKDPNAYASALHDLATVLIERGETVRARELLEEARGLYPDGHWESAGVLLALGQITPGAKGRELITRAVTLFEETLGELHPDTAQYQFAAAFRHAADGDLEGAWRLADKASRNHRRHLRRTLASLSEQEGFRYLEHIAWQLELQLGLALAIDDAKVRVEAYEVLLAWKGQVRRSLWTSRQRLRADLPAKALERTDELQRTLSELSALVTESDEGSSRARSKRVVDLQRKRNEIELEVRRLVAPPDELRWDDVADALPRHAALVDFVVGPVYENGSWSEPKLMAWITRADRAAPAVLDLGLAEPLAASVETFLGDLVARRGKALQAEEGESADDELRGALWEPVAAHLGGVERVFVSPDGFLGTLPFETLRAADGSFLIEQHAFVYLEDATALVSSGPPEAASGRSSALLAIGGVDYGARSEPSAAASDRGSFSSHWARLRHTEYEAQVVDELHDQAFGDERSSMVLRGGEATEERLKLELQTAGVVHLATHGFFQPKGLPSMLERVPNERGRGAVLQLREEDRTLVGNHPGLLSGLVCSGANEPAKGRDDGYLTAEEVSWLDLASVDLVVLSACETGLGRARAGEGMIGLRRSFHQAGARTVISSLWSVKDESTSDLMQRFYQYLWVDGLPRHEALRTAQLDLLDQNRLENDGSGVPSTWGAFVLSGDWR
jgi:CHAT domain-containing protein